MLWKPRDDSAARAHADAWFANPRHAEQATEQLSANRIADKFRCRACSSPNVLQIPHLGLCEFHLYSPSNGGWDVLSPNPKWRKNTDAELARRRKSEPRPAPF